MGKTNKYLDLWRKLVMEHRRKHGGTLKEAMQNKSVKAEYARRKKSLGGSSRVSPRRASSRRASPRKMTSPRRRKTSPAKRRKTSPTKRRKTSPTKRRRKSRK